MLRRLIRLKKNEQGATAIEFAAVAIPLFLILFAVLEFALIFATVGMLESATQRVARDQKALAGQAGGNINKNQIRNRISDYSSNFIKTNRLIVVADDLESDGGWSGGETSDGWGSGQTFRNNSNTVNRASNAASQNAGYATARSQGRSGNTGEIIQYRVYYTHYLYTPFMAKMLEAANLWDTADGGKGIELQSSAVVQNEPALP